MRDTELAGRIRHHRVEQHPQGARLVRSRAGVWRLAPGTPLHRRRVARPAWASRPCVPNPAKDQNTVQRQVMKAHDRIRLMNVANLPPTATTLGPCERALDADEPVSPLCPLGREDPCVGQGQRHLNRAVHRASPHEPLPRSPPQNRFCTLRHRAALHGSSGRALIFNVPIYRGGIVYVTPQKGCGHRSRGLYWSSSGVLSQRSGILGTGCGYEISRIQP